MTTTILVMSDLHLVDGHPGFEEWGPAQQAAFTALLAATRPGRPLASASVELILNGDTFDFLLAQPHLGPAIQTDVSIAHAKWTGIAAAHEPWFGALRQFLAVPGRRLTFLIGNHDQELIFPSIRARVRSIINAAPGTVRFCLGRAYAPFPDVHIEHGCQFDAFNVLPGIWEHVAPPTTPRELETSDTRGQAIGPALLPWGSRYYTHVFLPIKERYPYLDRMSPDFSFLRQLALLSVLAPEAAHEAARHTADLVSDPREVLAAFATAEEDPAALFSAALVSAAAVVRLVSGERVEADDNQATISEIAELQQAVALPRLAAIEAIVTRSAVNPHTIAQTHVMAASLGAGSHGPRLHVLGHTHAEGRWSLSNSGALLNTGTWVTRYAAPTTEEWFADLATWFIEQRQSGRMPRDASRFTAAWLRNDPEAATVGELIAWHDEDYIPVADDVSFA